MVGERGGGWYDIRRRGGDVVPAGRRLVVSLSKVVDGHAEVVVRLEVGRANGRLFVVLGTSFRSRLTTAATTVFSATHRPTRIAIAGETGRAARLRIRPLLTRVRSVKCLVPGSDYDVED